MKKINVLSIIAGVALLLFVNACKKDDDKLPDNEAKGTITTESDGEISTADGFSIRIYEGCIMQSIDGTSGVLDFTVNSDVSVGDLPVAIPGQFSLSSKIVHYGPDDFVFVSPVQLHIPVPNASSPAGLVVLWLGNNSQSWEIMPINDIDAENKRLGISVLKLGYFAVVNDNTLKGSDATLNQRPRGGLWLYHGNPPVHPNWGDQTKQYSYQFTIVNVELQYPEESYLNQVGKVAGTVCNTAACGNLRPNTVMPYLPLGAYTVKYSRYKRGDEINPSGGPLETYSVSFTVELTAYSSTGSGSWSDYQIDNSVGWAQLKSPPEGGSWSGGIPDLWDPPTQPGAEPIVPDNHPLNGKWNVTITAQGESNNEVWEFAINGSSGYWKANGGQVAMQNVTLNGNAFSYKITLEGTFSVSGTMGADNNSFNSEGSYSGDDKTSFSGVRY
ncbi:MAG TPA: hypothetical protein PLM34_03455 [Lentimicrobium sp.]|nr:hypothetical protein [Lentimicrobium sp.]